MRGARVRLPQTFALHLLEGGKVKFKSALWMLLPLLLAPAACGGSTQAPVAGCQPAVGHPPLIRTSTLIVAINATSPPSQFLDKNGDVAGLNVDLMNGVAKDMCLNLSWVNIPFDAQIPGLQGGRWDATSSGTFYKEARAKIVKLVPYATQGISISVAKDNPLHISSSKDLAGRAVGVEAPGFEYDTAVLVNKNQVAAGLRPMDIHTFQLLPEAYQALSAGQVAAVITGDQTVSYYSKLGRFSAVMQGISPSPICLAFADENVANKAADALNKMKQDGRYAAIFKNYGLEVEEWPPSMGAFSVHTGPLVLPPPST